MKKFNIILEGCDKVGKSSIYQIILARGLCTIGTHFGVPESKEKAKQTYYDTLKFLNSNDGIVFDRWALGEKIYGPILRKYEPDYMDDLESKIADHNILVLVKAHPNIVRERFDGKGIKIYQIEAVLENFWKEFLKAKYPNKFIIDTSNITADKAVDRLERILKKGGWI
jgi:thymidylate kinase